MHHSALKRLVTVIEVAMLVWALVSGARTAAAAVPASLKDEMRMPWQRAPEAASIRDWLICGEFPNPPAAGANPAAPRDPGASRLCATAD
jgi:hypothetical protein